MTTYYVAFDKDRGFDDPKKSAYLYVGQKKASFLQGGYYIDSPEPLPEGKQRWCVFIAADADYGEHGCTEHYEAKVFDNYESAFKQFKEWANYNGLSREEEELKISFFRKCEGETTYLRKIVFFNKPEPEE